MADCLTPEAATNFASKDSNRLVGQIAKALAYNSPFVGLLTGGTFPSGTSDTIRSVIQEQALTADSLNSPTFTATKDLCGPVNSTENVASTEYSYTLGTKRAFGPKVCVKNGFSAFQGAYSMAEDSLKKLIGAITNADIRKNLYSRSGVKFVAGNSGVYSFSQCLTGGESQIDVAFANIPQNSIGQLNFKTVHTISRYLRETLLGEPFEDRTAGMHYKFIGGSDIVEQFRNEIGVKEVLVALTTGGYKFGSESLTAYQWETSTAYRGIALGVDQRPLRASAVVAGVPTLVEPFVSVATTNGNASRVNPAWVSAPFEVAFLVGANSFKRLVPERYTGEGSFKFAPQLAAGELQWHYVIDNNCNPYGDFGWHKYEITRAFQPVRPANVVPILFRRCPYDLGIAACSNTGSLL